MTDREDRRSASFPAMRRAGGRAMRSAGRSRTAASLWLVVLAGCLSPSEPPEILLWDGDLLVAEAGPADLVGTAAMVAHQFQTEMGVGIESAPPGTSYGWRVYNGTCVAPNDPVGPQSSFPALQVATDETAEAVAVIQRRLTGTEYAVQVVENADGSGAAVACADLTRRT